MTHAHDRQSAEAAREAAERARQQRTADLDWLAASPRGRRILWQLLEHCGVFSTSIAANPEQTYFREGMRNVGLALLSEITAAAPEAWPRMVAEAAADPAVEPPRPHPHSRAAGAGNEES